MSVPERFIGFIKKENLFGFQDQLMLAVSGGVDSVVLCELCHQAGFHFSIVHCNFQLRREESDRDEMFVKKLAEKYGVEVQVKKFETEKYAAENKLSIQQAARILRYEWFDELMSSSRTKAAAYQNTILLTAHHADDNAETVLMNFCRGTGLHGLTGIPVSNGTIRRPLLQFTKKELLDFARQMNLGYVEDSSNSSNKYTRNFFRNEILPAIRQVFPQVTENLNDNIHRFQEVEKLYKTAVDVIKKKLIRQNGSDWYIPVKQLLAYNNRALIFEIFSSFGFSEKQIDEIRKLAGSTSGSYLDSPVFPFRLIKHRHWLVISPVHSAESGMVIIEEGNRKVNFEAGFLHFDILQKPAEWKHPAAEVVHSRDPYLATFDLQKISFPLILRKWKAGDYFYPLGMQKKKKLSRFFIDQKLSRSEKERIWVLESNKKIIWVIGRRIDDRCKVTELARSLLVVRLETP